MQQNNNGNGNFAIKSTLIINGLFAMLFGIGAWWMSGINTGVVRHNDELRDLLTWRSERQKTLDIDHEVLTRMNLEASQRTETILRMLELMRDMKNAMQELSTQYNDVRIAIVRMERATDRRGR